MRAQRARLTHRHQPCGLPYRDAARFRHQPESDLASPGEFDINLSKQLSVEQRAMLDPVAAVDPETHAQGIETMLCARMLRPREGQRVDHSLQRDARTAAQFELGIKEIEIEARVVRDQGRIFDEGEQLLDLVGKARLVGKEHRAETVDRLRLERHVALGVEVAMIMPAGFDPVVNLDAADLDHAIAAGGVQPRGLCVEDDFAHGLDLSTGRESEAIENVTHLGFSCG